MNKPSVVTMVMGIIGCIWGRIIARANTDESQVAAWILLATAALLPGGYVIWLVQRRVSRTRRYVTTGVALAAMLVSLAWEPLCSLIPKAPVQTDPWTPGTPLENYLSGRFPGMPDPRNPQKHDTPNLPGTPLENYQSGRWPGMKDPRVKPLRQFTAHAEVTVRRWYPIVQYLVNGSTVTRFSRQLQLVIEVFNARFRSPDNTAENRFSSQRR